jgi:superfamily I DNA/RNA helicase
MDCQEADYIIVDEVQDFSKNTIDIFRKKAKKALILFGDSAQQIYEGRESWSTGYGGTPMDNMEAISVHLGRELRELAFNHRLPKKIGRFAEYLNDTGLELRCRNEGVEKPKILHYRSLNDQLDAIVEIIKNRNFEDVGILFRHNAEVQNAYKYLSEKGLNIEAKYDDKTNWQNNKMTLNFNSDNPKLMTYHSSKGLQFEAVFLPDCICSSNDDRNPLYVAITRTYQSLYIMHSGNLSSFFDAIPTHLYETSLITNNIELL